MGRVRVGTCEWYFACPFLVGFGKDFEIDTCFARSRSRTRRRSRAAIIFLSAAARFCAAAATPTGTLTDPFGRLAGAAAISVVFLALLLPFLFAAASARFLQAFCSAAVSWLLPHVPQWTRTKRTPVGARWVPGGGALNLRVDGFLTELLSSGERAGDRNGTHFGRSGAVMRDPKDYDNQNFARAAPTDPLTDWQAPDRSLFVSTACVFCFLSARRCGSTMRKARTSRVDVARAPIPTSA